MKTRIIFALLGTTTVAAPAFSPLALAQSNEQNAYKKTWAGVASLKTLTKKEVTRDMMAVYPVFGGSRPVAQVAGLVLKNDAIKGFNDFAKDSEGSAEKLGLQGGMKYEYEYAPSLVLNRPRLISVTTMSYEFTAGAHGMYDTSGYVFGFPSGTRKARQLHLADFFTTGIAARKHVNNLLMAKLRATKNQAQDATWVLDGTVKSVTNAQIENFIVEPNGLHWYFAPYEMGPFANGEYEVKLTTRELGPTFRAAMLR